LRTLRRLQHDLVIVTRCMSAPLPVAVRASVGEELEGMATILSNGLRELAQAMAERRPPPDIGGVERAIERYTNLMDRERESPAMQRLPSNEAERIYALGFALAQLRRNLGDLHARCLEFVLQPLVRRQ